MAQRGGRRRSGRRVQQRHGQGPYRRATRCQGRAGRRPLRHLHSRRRTEAEGAGSQRPLCDAAVGAAGAPAFSRHRAQHGGHRPAARTRRRLAALPHHRRYRQGDRRQSLRGGHAYGRLRSDRRGVGRARCVLCRRPAFTRAGVEPQQYLRPRRSLCLSDVTGHGSGADESRLRAGRELAIGSASSSTSRTLPRRVSGTSPRRPTSRWSPAIRTFTRSRRSPATSPTSNSTPSRRAKGWLD